MSSPTEDWSEFVQPHLADAVVELAGRWKHGWIPLDGTAISSKMKGNTSGKKWWDDKGGTRKSVAGIPKKGTKSRREGLTTKEVPSARFKKRPTEGASRSLYQDGKIGVMDKKPTAGGKPIDVMQKRLTGSGQAVRTLGNQADTLAQNYVKMHGTDGARKKLAALKKTKTSDPRKRELIAALQKALGGDQGKA